MSQLSSRIFVHVCAVSALLFWGCDDGGGAEDMDVMGGQGATGGIAGQGGAGGESGAAGIAGQGGEAGIAGIAGQGGLAGMGGEAGGAAGQGGLAGAGGDAGSQAGTPGESFSQFVDPNCIDGQWQEPLPIPEASLDTAIAQFSGADVTPFIYDVLNARYPLGAHLIREGLERGAFDECVDFFLRDRSSPQAVITQLPTAVHECAHSADLALGGFTGHGYIITEALTYTCEGGDTTERFGNTFARSRLVDDEFYGQRPACDAPGPGSGSCDNYANVYLDGDPDDDEFDGGDQGFNSLLEETLQYVNSLATGYAIQDFYRGSRSDRDGILTFLWYLQRYLRMARLTYPDAYDHLAGDACWRETILTVWGRAWLYLETTEGMPALGIRDDAIYPLATTPVLLEEIQRLRDLQGCN